MQTRARRFTISCRQASYVIALLTLGSPDALQFPRGYRVLSYVHFGCRAARPSQAHLHAFDIASCPRQRATCRGCRSESWRRNVSWKASGPCYVCERPSFGGFQVVARTSVRSSFSAIIGIGAARPSVIAGADVVVAALLFAGTFCVTLPTIA